MMLKIFATVLLVAVNLVVGQEIVTVTGAIDTQLPRPSPILLNLALKNTSQDGTDFIDVGASFDGLIKFPTLSIAPDKVVESAVLRLYLEWTTMNPFPNVYPFHRVTQAWDVGVTYDDFGPASVVPGVHATYIPTAFFVGPGVDGGVVDIDVTEDVKYWVENPALNQGWFIIGRVGVPLRFATTEHPTFPEPRIVITVSDASAAPTMSPSMAPIPNPTVMPSPGPSKPPTRSPTSGPSPVPSRLPIRPPSVQPTSIPTSVPTTLQPSRMPAECDCQCPTNNETSGMMTMTPSALPGMSSTAPPTPLQGSSTSTPSVAPVAPGGGDGGTCGFSRMFLED